MSGNVLPVKNCPCSRQAAFQSLACWLVSAEIVACSQRQQYWRPSDAISTGARASSAFVARRAPETPHAACSSMSPTIPLVLVLFKPTCDHKSNVAAPSSSVGGKRNAPSSLGRRITPAATLCLACGKELFCSRFELSVALLLGFKLPTKHQQIKGARTQVRRYQKK